MCFGQFNTIIESLGDDWISDQYMVTDENIYVPAVSGMPVFHPAQPFCYNPLYQKRRKMRSGYLA